MNVIFSRKPNSFLKRCDNLVDFILRTNPHFAKSRETEDFVFSFWKRTGDRFKHIHLADTIALITSRSRFSIFS